MSKLEKINEGVQIWCLSILGGIMIAIASLVYLSIPDRILGALAFGLGLFFIVMCNFKLYTGEIGYLKNYIRSNKAIFLLVIFAGNILGVLFFWAITYYARIDLEDVAWSIIAPRLNLTDLEVFVRSCMCGFILYFGIMSSRRNEGMIKVLCLFLAVFTFIVAGGIHCIAELSYCLYSNYFNMFTLFRFFLIAIGNSFGSLIASELFN